MHTTFRMLWLLRRWDYVVWLWVSLWSKGIVSKIPCQALVLIPVSVLFLSTERTLSQTHVISVTDRESENWILYERGQKRERKYRQGFEEAFLFMQNRVVLSVLLILHNKDLNYRLWACTVWFAMRCALFMPTSKSQLLMKILKKNQRKWKNWVRKLMKEQWCNSREMKKRRKLDIRVREDIGYVQKASNHATLTISVTDLLSCNSNRRPKSFKFNYKTGLKIQNNCLQDDYWMPLAEINKHALMSSYRMLLYSTFTVAYTLLKCNTSLHSGNLVQ